MEVFTVMRKVIYILVLTICLSGCAGGYDGWKEVEMHLFGSIKIPQGWTYHIQDCKIYFTDEGVTEFTEDTVHLAGYIYGEGDDIGPAYKMFDENVISGEYIKGEIFSNSTRRGIKQLIINGKLCEKAYLKLYDVDENKEIYMIAWDDSVDYDDIKKIAKSFDRADDE